MHLSANPFLFYGRRSGEVLGTIKINSAVAIWIPFKACFVWLLENSATLTFPIKVILEKMEKFGCPRESEEIRSLGDHKKIIKKIL